MSLPYLEWFCCGCGQTPADGVEVEEQYSLGIYAGRWCAPCWDASGFRKEGAGAFSPADAGESYEPD
jgi:hypothetical protein